jgi:hypothetical protein
MRVGWSYQAVQGSADNADTDGAGNPADVAPRN